MTTPDAAMAVPERALRARRARALWIEPIYFVTFLLTGTYAAGHAFDLGPLTRRSLFGGVVVVGIVLLVTRRWVRARVGDPRLRFAWRQEAPGRRLTMFGVLAVSLPIALLAWWDPRQHEGLVLGAFGLVVPLVCSSGFWELGGWLRAVIPGQVAVLVPLLIWPPAVPNRYWVGNFVGAVGMLVLFFLCDLKFWSDVRAARREAEADGDTV